MSDKIQELIALVRELAAEIDRLEGESPASEERNEYIERLCREVTMSLESARDEIADQGNRLRSNDDWDRGGRYWLEWAESRIDAVLEKAQTAPSHGGEGIHRTH